MYSGTWTLEIWFSFSPASTSTMSIGNGWSFSGQVA
jgi:hypothetical protein